MSTNTQKNIIVTGANRGIGLSLAKIYLARGDRVFAVCRHTSSALNQSGAEVIEGVDVCKPETLRLLKQAIGNIQVDVLINNAGILHSESLGEINYDDISQQLAVNAIGPLRVTEFLLPYLSSGAKLGLVTSRMGSMADNGSGGYYGYRMSKAALNAAGKSLANDLKARGISVAVLHPGFVQTDMVNNSGDISADTAAERLSNRLDELNLDNSGTFWHSNGEVLPW